MQITQRIQNRFPNAAPRLRRVAITVGLLFLAAEVLGGLMALAIGAFRPLLAPTADASSQAQPSVVAPAPVVVTVLPSPKLPIAGSATGPVSAGRGAPKASSASRGRRASRASAGVSDPAPSPAADAPAFGDDAAEHSGAAGTGEFLGAGMGAGGSFFRGPATGFGVGVDPLATRSGW